MCNVDIRNAAGGYGIRLWQVAEEIGMNESAFSRKMRKELKPEEKEKVLAAIQKIAERSRG